MRYTALQILCDQVTWESRKDEILGTNFIEIGGHAPRGHFVKERAPWIDIVTDKWEHSYASLKTRDDDGWRRIHQASIYVDPSTNSAKRRLVVFGFDVRSEYNY
jgi:hypothetical protein